MKPIEPVIYCSLSQLRAWAVLGIWVACHSWVLAQTPKILIFSRTAAFRHTSIPKGVQTLQTLGREFHYGVDWTESSASFSDSTLAKYAAVVFLNTTGNVLDSAQQSSFERFIGAGKGYVGIHAAADTEYDWPFYRQLVGRQFVQHPANQRAVVYPIGFAFPGLSGFEPKVELFEEWYDYSEPYVDGLHYLLAVDTNTYSMRGPLGASKMGAFHPIAWYHEFGGGRGFYTGLGHLEATYDNLSFKEHLSAGLQWAITGSKKELMKPKILGLRTVIYPVPDVAVAKTWYAQAFGVEPYFDEPYYVGFNIGGFELGLQPYEEGQKAAVAKTSPNPAPVSYWGVSDLKVSFADMLKHGATSLEAPNNVGGEIEVATLADPWGNVIGLICNPHFGK